ncbi:hypothetical protein F4804DRAFT_344694 [Jackrogersella minutella]|nr:hypothetical protein F4804DRAFT_344694 [Jackrogersella minutella]
MAIEVVMNTPLADALNMAIQPKLVEVGWASGGADDSALSEYIILMLVNGKTQDQIAAELAGDLLSLGPDDPGARDFAKWLFDEIESLNSQLNGGSGQLESTSGDATQNAMSSLDQDMDMSMPTDGPELNAPTGPRSMRNAPGRGGREKRMLGQMAKAMDRTHDSVLHRVRANGNERINTHRAPPTGPRGGFGRGNSRTPNNRAAGIAAQLGPMVGNNLPPHIQAPPGMNGMNDLSWMLPGAQEQIFQMIQQQNQMMQQMQQQLNQQGQQGQNAGGRPHGRSLFDRVQNPRGGRRGGHANGHRSFHADSATASETGADNEDVDMTQGRREPLNPDSMVCKYNLACTNKDCKFAHQSPAAPPNTTVDINDVCAFGAACKNRKCVGRHPSPATRRAHQIEQECKFYPNCTNPSCPFKHPDMPPCRNGGDCAVEGCKFTHLQTMCKYKPCTNRFCPYKHEEGQRGTFQDKVWTADGTEHVKDAFITLLRSAYRSARHETRARMSGSLASRRMSSLAARSTAPNPSIGQQLTRVRSEKLLRVRCRTFATTGARNGKPREIAVLGGGITGLTTAHYLARYSGNANITLYEGSDRLGGWLNGSLVSVGDGKHDNVLFQHGPRMLRSSRASMKYDDLVFYDVVAALNLADKLRPAEYHYNDRYIYYPDHLVKLPSPDFTPANIFSVLYSFITEPLFSGAFKSYLNMSAAGKKSRTDMKMSAALAEKLAQDQSIGDFFTELFGDDRLVKNVMSGMIHGIYGGDIYKLSVRHSIFDTIWLNTMVFRFRGIDWMNHKDFVLQSDILRSRYRHVVKSLAQKAVDWNIFMFEDGLLTLVNGFAKTLREQNVTVKTGSKVTSLVYENRKMSVTTADKPGRATQYDQVICTLFSKDLARIVEPQARLPALADTHAVTIMVVNLWFPNPNLLADNHGFGYLVPSTTPNNDECVLGVLFDSDLEMRDEKPGTKLTVMLGGHHWDGWAQLPTEEMGKAMALQAVQRHLGISPDEKVFSKAHMCRECLPQHYVGHSDRMCDAHHELLSAFEGRLTVAGPSYTGIGVMPAMRAAFDAAMRVARGHASPWFYKVVDDDAMEESLKTAYGYDHVGLTGLEGFTHSRKNGLDTCSPTKLADMPFRRWTAPGFVPWSERVLQGKSPEDRGGKD